MRRTLLVFLLLLLRGAALPATAATLGKLARKVGTVQAQPTMRDKVIETGMQVWTGERSVAKIALTDPATKKTCGAVTLGPVSSFLFDDTVLRPVWLSLKLAVGVIRAAFVPTLAGEEAQALLGVRPHEVQIDTQSAQINIHGSDVYVSFDPGTGITRVYVQEGSADVTAVQARVQSRATVQVAAGEMTEVPSGGGPPAPPRPPGPVPPGPWNPDVFPDPILKLTDPRWDLPK